MTSLKKFIIIPSLFVIVFLLVFWLLPASTSATPEYSLRTSQGCRTCHTEADEGALSETGLEYAASGYVWPPKGGYRVLGPIRKPVRLVIGLFHIVAAFIWFGTILYVHLLLRPAYASKGLPKGEMFMGLFSMAIVGATGIFLTVSRIKGIEVLYKSPWGLLLSAKIIIFLIMVSSALFVVAFVGPKLKKGGLRAVRPKDGVFDPVGLSAFDGKEGREAFIAYKGNVYDATGLKLWRDGKHMKHSAGEDLTESLSKAPHGEEKLSALKTAGTLNPSLKPPMMPVQKAFYFIAYMNLALVFVALFVISLWRWGI